MGVVYLTILFLIITFIAFHDDEEMLWSGIVLSFLAGAMIGGIVFAAFAPVTDLNPSSEIIESASYDLISLDRVYADADGEYVVTFDGKYYVYYLNEDNLVTQVDTTNLTYGDTPKLYYYKWYNSNNKLVRHLFLEDTSEKYVIVVPPDKSAAVTKPSGFSLTFTKN